MNDWPFVRRIVSPGETYAFGLSNSYVINPYGGRVLDQESDLPIDTQLNLEKDVRAAYRFHVNGRPSNPDITKLRRPSGG